MTKLIHTLKLIYIYPKLLSQIILWECIVSSDRFSARKRSPYTYKIHNVLQVTHCVLVTSLEPDKAATTKFALMTISGQ